MSNQLELVKDYYQALNNGDYKKLSKLYHKKASYNDPIFSFQGKEILALWYTSTRPEMNMKAVIHAIEEEKDVVKTEWTVSYTIPTLKKRISLNEIGVFRFEENKIIAHSDDYSFYDWCKQAFGLIGVVFGWSNWLKQKVQRQARKSVLANLYAAQK